MPKKILIADDEEVVRDAVRVSLEGDDYELLEAENSEEALRIAKDIKPDLIILDLMMPDKWGYAVSEELKKDPHTKDTIILILTGRRSPLSRRMGEIKGGDDYIVKPFDPAELRKKVKMLLGME
jgi:DNA-binding response OmpR family regulator